MDWGKAPDIVAVALLAWAFASISRRNDTRLSGIWLIGWILIVVHFIAFMFAPLPGDLGKCAEIAGIVSLEMAGLLFMWTAVPHPHEKSTLSLLTVLLVVNAVYSCLVEVSSPVWILDCAAVLLGMGPLAVALNFVRGTSRYLRWTTVGLCCLLSLFLLYVQHRPVKDPDIALEGILFTIYFNCCIHFWRTYHRNSAGAFITISGFFLWAFVFITSSLKSAYFPGVHIDGEVWNLPKYIVAVGMILLLLEDQIEYNKHLALHDVLTGLPNRRLFQERLADALKQARCTGTKAALLVLDLDQFKHVNDTQGHHVGDLLLRHVAEVFSRRIRRSDTVARTGGDEFSVILQSPMTSTEALRVGRSLQELLREPLQIENRIVAIGASLGIAIFPDDALDMESLCIAADLKMYENKRASSASPIVGHQFSLKSHKIGLETPSASHDSEATSQS